MMTKVSESANVRWRELCEGGGNPNIVGPYLIQQVSDAAKAARDHGVTEEAWDALGPLILREPMIDPLVTALADLGTGFNDLPLTESATFLRHSLAKRGLQIVPVPHA